MKINFKNQSGGYTLTELLIALGTFLVGVCMAGVIVVIIHFITKYW
jgi:hypothetical protein